MEIVKAWIVHGAIGFLLGLFVVGFTYLLTKIKEKTMIEMIKFWFAQVIVQGVVSLLLVIGVVAFSFLIDKIDIHRR